MTSYQPPNPQPRKSRALTITLAVTGIVVVLCLGGIVAALITGGDAVDKAVTAIESQDAANRSAAAPATSPATPTTTGPARVEPGTYTAGEDIPAGRYKVTDRAEDLCYWQVSSSTGSLIDNGAGGGFPQFTIRKGQQVEIMFCPTFELQTK